MVLLRFDTVYSVRRDIVRVTGVVAVALALLLLILLLLAVVVVAVGTPTAAGLLVRGFTLFPV